MRLLIRLDAERDASYNPEYHHKLRGVIWKALQNTEYTSLHGDSDTVSFNYSNPFPVGEISEGDRRNVIVSSPHDGLISALHNNLESGEEFNIGEMPFRISDMNELGVDVGEPGTKGVLKSDTGIYIPLKQERWDEFGIDYKYDADEISWTRDYSFGVFLQRMRELLSWKHERVFDDYLNNVGPETELFEAANFKKDYAVKIPVSSNNMYEKTFVVSKWSFEYRVKNDDHRRWLNLLLDAGAGARNSLGFGFMNKVLEE